VACLQLAGPHFLSPLHPALSLYLWLYRLGVYTKARSGARVAGGPCALRDLYPAGLGGACILRRAAAAAPATSLSPGSLNGQAQVARAYLYLATTHRAIDYATGNIR